MSNIIPQTSSLVQVSGVSKQLCWTLQLNAGLCQRRLYWTRHQDAAFYTSTHHHNFHKSSITC